MTTERIARQLRKARKLGDKAAVAILEGGRTFSDVAVDDRYSVLTFRRVAPATEREKLAGWAR